MYRTIDQGENDQPLDLSGDWMTLVTVPAAKDRTNILVSLYFTDLDWGHNVILRCVQDSLYRQIEMVPSGWHANSCSISIVLEPGAGPVQVQAKDITGNSTECFFSYVVVQTPFWD